MEWNGTGIKTEQFVPFFFICDPFCFHLQSVHCSFTKMNGPIHFVKRNFLGGVYTVCKTACKKRDRKHFRIGNIIGSQGISEEISSS